MQVIKFISLQYFHLLQPEKFSDSNFKYRYQTKPGILSQNLKTLTSSNYPTVQYFLLKLRTRFLLTIVYKRVCGIFLFYLDLELFAKIKKDLVSTYSFFTLSVITQDLNKIKKNPTNPFVDITKQKTCAKFQQKILKSMVVGARQSFQFFRQKNWFLGNNRGLR